MTRACRKQSIPNLPEATRADYAILEAQGDAAEQDYGPDDYVTQVLRVGLADYLRWIRLEKAPQHPARYGDPPERSKALQHDRVYKRPHVCSAITQAQYLLWGLIHLSRAAVVTAKSVQEVKRVADVAEGVRVYAQRSGEAAKEVEMHAA